MKGLGLKKEKVNSQVPQDIIHDARYQDPGHLCNDLTNHKWEPTIHFRQLFTSLKDASVVDEMGLELGEQTGGDKHAVEDGEKSVL